MSSSSPQRDLWTLLIADHRARHLRCSPSLQRAEFSFPFVTHSPSASRRWFPFDTRRLKAAANSMTMFVRIIATTFSSTFATTFVTTAVAEFNSTAFATLSATAFAEGNRLTPSDATDSTWRVRGQD
ncbi:unnamed protein product [Closterium sp. NIES-53]